MEEEGEQKWRRGSRNGGGGAEMEEGEQKWRRGSRNGEGGGAEMEEEGEQKWFNDHTKGWRVNQLSADFHNIQRIY